MDKVKQLAEALKRAEAAALAADPMDDGGSCNLDSPTIYLSRWRGADVQRAAELAGVALDEIHWLGRRRYFVRTTTHGQANRRSTMAEAANKSLRNDGYEALMFCHTD